MSWIKKTEEIRPHYKILKPVSVQPKPARFNIYNKPLTATQWMKYILKPAGRSRLVALDLETKGTNPFDPENRIVGLGLAWGESSGAYVNMDAQSVETMREVLPELAKLPLIVFNLMFESLWLTYTADLLGLDPKWNWKADVYAYYKQLANEGWTGQNWGLKQAQVDLLGWDEKGDADLDAWLIGAGHYKESGKKGERVRKADKSQMYRAPADVLGHYCLLDSQSTLQLMEHVMEPALKEHPIVRAYHEGEFLGLCKWLVRQQIDGMPLDMEKLTEVREQLTKEIAELDAEFYACDHVSPHLEEWKRMCIETKYYAKPFPEQFTKSGKVSKTHINKWTKVTEAWRTPEAEYFNPNSAQQLAWLFYEKLFTPERIEEGRGSRTEVKYNINGALLPATDSGKPPTNKDAYPHLGPAGKILAKRAEKQKLLEYANSYDELQRDGMLHPGFKNPGTLTGRLSGREPNCFHPKTELLTPKGWVPVLELTEADYVWEVNPHSLIGNWVKPKLIKQDWKGNMYNFGTKSRSLSVTANHPMTWWNEGKPGKVGLAQDLFPQSRAHLPTSSLSAETCKSHSEKEIWLTMMTQADAARRGRGRWEVGFRKQHKIIKAEELLAKSLKKQAHAWAACYKFVSNLLTDDKLLNLQKLSTTHVNVFLDALAFWDSHDGRGVPGRNRITYTSKEEHNVDQVQAYLSRCGVKSVKGARRNRVSYYLTISMRGLFKAIKKDTHVHKHHYEGPVGCVSVPKSHVLVRSDGNVYVTHQCQQLPGSPEVLDCFVAPEGYVIFESDWASLEDYVAANVSQCPGLLAIIGPDAKPNDGHLYVGSQLPVLGDKIRAAGYDPEDPTKEMIDHVKEVCKKERAVCKTVKYSSVYGVGKHKLHQTLSMANIKLTVDEVGAILRGYWDVHSGVRDYKSGLEREWKQRRGWIYNAIGRPVACADTATKDLFNRAIQSGGHDLNMMFSNAVMRLSEERGVGAKPYIIDLHDSAWTLVPENKIEDMVKLYNDAADEVWQWCEEALGWNCRLTVSTAYGRTIKEVKYGR